MSDLTSAVLCWNFGCQNNNSPISVAALFSVKFNAKYGDGVSRFAVPSMESVHYKVSSLMHEWLHWREIIISGT